MTSFSHRGARLTSAVLAVTLVASACSSLSRTEKGAIIGAQSVIDYTQEDPVAAIKRLTGGRGVDVAIEALGTQQTFENALRATRPAAR